MLTIREVKQPMNEPNHSSGRIWPSVKRALDVTGSAVVIVVLSPLWVMLAVAIRIDSPGPMLFRQRRLGRGCRPFVMLKFRSMEAGASSDLHRRYIEQLVHEDPAAGETLRKLTDDRRVTRVGRLLRRTSLDEAPQLLNVLAGHMSLIGPRPALEYELEHYRPHHFRRFEVRPGLTGLWQTSGRARVGFMEMLELDVEYVRRFSVSQDARILLKTPLALRSSQTA